MVFCVRPLKELAIAQCPLGDGGACLAATVGQARCEPTAEPSGPQCQQARSPSVRPEKVPVCLLCHSHSAGSPTSFRGCVKSLIGAPRLSIQQNPVHALAGALHGACGLHDTVLMSAGLSKSRI